MTQLVNPEVDPSLVIRAYLYEVLKENDPDVWKESNYGGLNPVAPLAEEPELTQYNFPYVIYVQSYEPFRAGVHDGSLTFLISDPNFRRLIRSLNIIRVALDREDETARDVNNFSSEPTRDYFHGLSFNYIRLNYAEGPAPAESEGGRNTSVLSIEYQYTVDYDVITEV